MGFPVGLVAAVAVLVSGAAEAEGIRGDELAAQQRAEAVLGRMTQAEKLSVVRVSAHRGAGGPNRRDRWDRQGTSPEFRGLEYRRCKRPTPNSALRIREASARATRRRLCRPIWHLPRLGT